MKVHTSIDRTHVATAAIVGVGLGLLYNVLIPVFSADADVSYRIGITLWYGTLGGCAGLLHHHLHDLWRGFHPHSPDWLTAGIFFAWCNGLLLMLAYDRITPLTNLALNVTLPSAWFIAEGLFTGVVIAFAAKSLSDHTGVW